MAESTDKTGFISRRSQTESDNSGYFGLSSEDAADIAAEITKTVRDNWERIAEKNGLGRSAVEYMRPAFSACY